MKYMNKRVVNQKSVNFKLASYSFLFILTVAILVFVIGIIELIFNFFEENWQSFYELQRSLFFYIKGLLGGIVIWIFRGLASLIIKGILSGIKFSYKTTREDGKVILNFILKYVMVVGYPIFILWGKRLFLRSRSTDFETRYFLLGYCTILYFVAIVVKGLWYSNPLGGYLKNMIKLLKMNGQD